MWTAGNRFCSQRKGCIATRPAAKLTVQRRVDYNEASDTFSIFPFLVKEL